MIRLFALHAIGNALLLWLGYWWLGMGESDNVHLLGSAALVFGLLAAAAWLHGSGFTYFSGLGFGRALARSARNLLPLLALCMCATAIYWVLTWLSGHYAAVAYNIASYSTLHLRKPVSPAGVQKNFQIAFLLLEWVVVPVLLLPLARAVAVEGWSGWRLSALRRSRRVLYWIEVGLLLGCALVLPYKLFFWLPAISSFSGQMTSFVLRNGIGYLLFVTALLGLEFFTSSGNPAESQRRTAASP